MQTSFDLVVIGGGPGGYVGAIKAAQKGMAVALVEQSQLGGTCLNRGCIPTKALMHTTHLYRELQAAEELGIGVDGLHVDIGRMYARKDAVVQKQREGIGHLLKANRLEHICGRGRVVAANTVEVETPDGPVSLQAKNILVATGSAPVLLPLPGMDLPGVLTSDDLLEGEPHSYQSIVIVGGGVIGVEFATILSSLGCQVTILEAMDRLLPTMDREIGQSLSMLLKKRGIAVVTGAVLQEVKRQGEELACEYMHKGENKRATGEAVLVAVGRRAVVEDLFAGDCQPRLERGIVVNKGFETSVPGIYAIGDVVNRGIQLAHVASAQAANAVCAMAGLPPEVDLSVVPSCVYTDPEIASVGLTADAAKAAGIEACTGKFLMAGLGKSQIEGQERGFIKLVFDAKSEALLGAQLMCARATDLVSELSTSIAARLTLRQLAGVIRPHPTFAEGVTEAAEDAEGRAVHMAPKRKRI